MRAQIIESRSILLHTVVNLIHSLRSHRGRDGLNAKISSMNSASPPGMPVMAPFVD